MNPGLSCSGMCPFLSASLRRPCCSIHVSTSLMTIALVTNASTHCVAQGFARAPTLVPALSLHIFFTYTVASSFVCASPSAVMTVVGFLGTLTVSSSAECRSILLSMGIGALDSTTNVLLMALVDTKLPMERRMLLCVLTMSLRILLDQFPRISAGASLLSSMSVLETGPQHLWHSDCAQEDDSVESLPVMDFLIPEF